MQDFSPESGSPPTPAQETPDVEKFYRETLEMNDAEVRQALAREVALTGQFDWGVCGQLMKDAIDRQFLKLQGFDLEQLDQAAQLWREIFGVEEAAAEEPSNVRQVLQNAARAIMRTPILGRFLTQVVPDILLPDMTAPTAGPEQ